MFYTPPAFNEKEPNLRLNLTPIKYLSNYLVFTTIPCISILLMCKLKYLLTV